MDSKPFSHLTIYQVLAKNNCGRCQLPSCLAFAAAVANGQKKISACPFVDEQTQAQLTACLTGKAEQELYRFSKELNELEPQVAQLNLPTLAPRIGGVFRDSRLIIKSFGKEFQIDQQGQVHSECHLIPWVKAPLLAYVVSSEHQSPTGRWLNFRYLPGGMERQNLFTTRCERLLKELADQHPGLLHDLAELFHGTKAEGFEADMALILHPLPHFPILICWHAPEDGMASSLTILFDACCAVNLPIQMAFSLCIGLAQMFGKIASLHK